MPVPESFELSTELQIGVAELDRQHRILVSIIDAARASLAGRGRRTAFERVTRDLLAYALHHFETEGRLMRETGYDLAVPEEAEAHLREHRDFSERVVALRAAAVDDWRAAADALLPFLEDWLARHVLGVDRHFGAYIDAHRDAGS
jgi:hemerythrin